MAKSGPIEVMLLATFWLFRPQFVIFHLFWPIWRFCDLSSLISTQFLDALKQKLFNGCTWTCRRTKASETKWRDSMEKDRLRQFEIEWKRWRSLPTFWEYFLHRFHLCWCTCLPFSGHEPQIPPQRLPILPMHFFVPPVLLWNYIFFPIRFRPLCFWEKDFSLPGPSLKLRKWNISMICFRLFPFCANDS